MNLQDQIGVLEAGVDQLLQAAAAAHSPRAGVQAAAEPISAPTETAAAAVGNAVGNAAGNAAANDAGNGAAHAASATVDSADAAPAPAAAPNHEANAPGHDTAIPPALEATATETPEVTAEPAAPAAEANAAAEPELRVARPSQNEITLTIGDQTVTLNALQVGQMVEELANARASMQPEPPPGIPPGWRFVSTKNPVMAVQKQSNGDRLLVMRHTGHGWVPFTFSPDMVVQMYMMLTQR
ncbi:hypothetical protein [Paraburkholderia acidisoli]|uniref:hypothetical protein n=1 Tax=Paraburkholderia acidisoli TaxID=2571748 RepID=UPI001E5BA075|nr:hypothetical protein [Paraburkholderia acidisoli]